jgi:integrase
MLRKLTGRGPRAVPQPAPPRASAAEPINTALSESRALKPIPITAAPQLRHPAAVARKPQVASNREVALMPPGKWRVEREPGLYLFVSPDGQVRRWLFRFTSPVTRKVTEAGLDLAPAVSLADAKDKAGVMRKQIAAGICPIQARRTDRANAVTFLEACDGWIATHKPAWKGASQMKNATVLLHQHGKALAAKRVADITPDDVQVALQALWTVTPLQARRALSMWERVFDFAKAKGMRQGSNPCEWRGLMEYRFPRVRRTGRGHYRAMPYQELPAFMKALRQKQERSTGAIALEFVILTCCRTGEALGATWEEIDFDNKLWTIPASRMKAGREHTVPLSERAMELLRLQKQYTKGSEFVFTGYRRTRFAEKGLLWVLRHMNVQASVHGFRSSFRDWCGNETNFAREPVEHCLAHQVGNAVEQAYRRQDALNKRRVIMDAWSTYCG